MTQMIEKPNHNNLKPRPPIVVVMGHVDHGKTTLLDYLRKTNVAAREAGGITQSVGAYEITHPRMDADNNADQRGSSAISEHPRSNQRESALPEGKKITFIDTPGHEAFIKMRTRGAHAADLAVLVVAADEGVKPQTKESVKILEETKTPFVVALTKTDKPNADVEKVKNDLTAHGILLEGYGGSVSYEAISAKTGAGVSELLDLLLIAAELEELSYDPASPASGYVLETRVDARRGLEAALIVKDGTLRFGDEIVTPSARGKVKILEDFAGRAVKSLEPSSPALVIGFETLPAVGEEFSAHRDAGSLPAAQASAPKKELLAPEEHAINMILKSSDAGSLEALSEIFRAMTLPVPVRILSESVGDVVDSEVKLAIPSKAVIFAFKNKIDKAARTLAEAHKIRIVSSGVIYELTRALEEIAKGGGDLALGRLNILAIFNQKKLEKQVVGGKVVSGVCRNRAAFTIVRPSADSTSSPQADPRPSQGSGGQAGQAAATVGRGRVTNLQQGKEEMHEVREGNEAGLLVQADIPIAVGDELVFEK